MRVVFGSMVLAVVAPAGGMRSCAHQDEPRTVSVAGGSFDEVRLGCHLTATEAIDADPVADTVPFEASPGFPESCLLVAYARTGALWQHTRPVELTAEDRRVELSFDEPVVAGIGVAFRRDPWRGEVVVTAVQGGTPAAGVLRPGDRVTSVDGVSVASGRWGFVDSVTGAPGTPVRVGILRDGSEQQHTFVREVVPLLR